MDSNSDFNCFSAEDKIAGNGSVIIAVVVVVAAAVDIANPKFFDVCCADFPNFDCLKSDFCFLEITSEIVRNSFRQN